MLGTFCLDLPPMMRSEALFGEASLTFVLQTGLGGCSWSAEAGQGRDEALAATGRGHWVGGFRNAARGSHIAP